MYIEEFFEKILINDLKKLKKYESLVLKSKNMEALHQMRVLLRRIRSLFSIFQLVIPKTTTHHFYIEIAKFASYLDRARDIDVYIGKYFYKTELTPLELLMYKIVAKYRKAEYKKISTDLMI